VLNDILLINQFTILNKLSPGSYDRQLWALRSNFELELDYLFEGVPEKSVSVEVCHEVHNILAMFSHLQASYDQLPDKSEIGERDVKFLGFDQNSEADQYDLTHYIFKQDRQCTNIKPPHLNSGTPYLPGYRRMYEAYEKYKHGRSDNPWLSVGEISDVLDKR
jgi:uncharacterized protein